MGARIGKLITETLNDVDSSDIEDRWDVEQGDGPPSYDSSESSNLEAVVDETRHYHQDPYIVEKRFVAGSNECTYNIIKRK